VSAVFLSPHCLGDDEALFGAFTLIRERPLVVVVYDCGSEREAETDEAMEVLGCQVQHWRLPPDVAEATISARVAALKAETVYAPLPETDGQPQHNTVGRAANGQRVVHYLTYTPAGKSTHGAPVPYEPAWVASKVQALACYPSQSGHPSHAPHFIRDQTEYIAA
jgi:hypothetical protein